MRGHLAATSCRDGKLGSRGISISLTAASVRSAARSLAERARGLAVTSASSATTGRLVDDAECRRRRQRLPAGGASRRGCRPRAAKKFFTMRSSSEWNDTTTSRPPGLEHALGRR